MGIEMIHFIRRLTYEVTGGVLLFGGHASNTVGSVEGTVALEGLLAGLSTGSVEGPANLEGGFPVRHDETYGSCWMVLEMKRIVIKDDVGRVRVKSLSCWHRSFESVSK